MPEYVCPPVRCDQLVRVDLDEIRTGDVIQMKDHQRLVRAVVRDPDGHTRYVYVEAIWRQARRPPFVAFDRELLRSAFGGILERGCSIPQDDVQIAIERRCTTLFTKDREVHA